MNIYGQGPLVEDEDKWPVEVPYPQFPDGNTWAEYFEMMHWQFIADEITAELLIYRTKPCQR